MDRAILLQPPEPHKPPLPHPGHPNHHALGGSFSRQHLRPPPLAIRSRPLSPRMDSPIHRPRLRRQAPGILQRLAFPLRRRPLVVGENPRQSLEWCVGDGRSRPPACTNSAFCSILSSPRGSTNGKHAAPHRQIPVARSARGKPRPASPGGNRRAACMLHPQGSSSLPRSSDLGTALRIRAARPPRRTQLQSRLLPRRHHRPLGSRPVFGIHSLRPECRGLPRRIESRFPNHRTRQFPIHPRPAFLLKPSPA
jgi:hypothetical protein